MDEEASFFASLEFGEGKEKKERVRRSSVLKKEEKKKWVPGKFLEDMEQYEGYLGEEVGFVPYQSTCPSYDDMTEEQRSWYFYWRAQVRKKWFLFTDTGYIYVLLFELVHGFGGTAQQCYEQLLELWQGYPDKEAQLEKNFQCWILDFALVHQLNLSLFMNVNRWKKLQSQQYNFIFHHYSDKDVVEVPCFLWDIKEEEYQVFEQLEELGYLREVEGILEEITHVVNQKCLRVRGKTLFQQYGTQKKVTYTGFYYQGMQVISAKPSYSLEVTDHFNYDKLLMFFHFLLLYTVHFLVELWEIDIDVSDAPIGRDLEEEIAFYLEENHPTPKERGVVNLFTAEKIRKSTYTAGDIDKKLQKIEQKMEDSMERTDPILSEKTSLQKRRNGEKDTESSFWQSLLITKNDTTSRQGKENGEEIDFSKRKPKKKESMVSVENYRTPQKKIKNEEVIEEKPEFTLDFSQIDLLRKESDQVRDALEVEMDLDEQIDGKVRYNSDLQDENLSAVLLCDETEDWKSRFKEGNQRNTCEVLLNKEKECYSENLVEKKDAHFENREIYVDIHRLSPELQDCWVSFSELQKNAVIHIAKQEQAQLEQLAETSFMMIDMLVDEINQVSMEIIGDILLEGQGNDVRILEEYNEIENILKELER